MPPYGSTYQPATQQSVGVGLNLPASILGIPTWVWIVGGAIFFLKHRGKL